MILDYVKQFRKSLNSIHWFDYVNKEIDNIENYKNENEDNNRNNTFQKLICTCIECKKRNSI